MPTLSSTLRAGAACALLLAAPCYGGACGENGKKASCLSDGCSWMRPVFNRRGKVAKKGECIDTPASCADASTGRVCAVATGNCEWESKECSDVQACDAAGSLALCDGVTDEDCSWFGSVKSRGRVIRKAECAVTPASCGDADSARMCGVALGNCQWDKEAKECEAVTSCADAKGRLLCEGVEEEACSFLPKVMLKRKVLKPAACITTPATCDAATQARECKVAEGNCKWEGGACVDVDTCEEATTEALCAGVVAAGGDCKWKKAGRKNPARCITVTPAPTAAPTAPPTTAAPTAPPTTAAPTPQVVDGGYAAKGTPCNFPFQFNGQTYNECVSFTENPPFVSSNNPPADGPDMSTWCATIPNYSSGLGPNKKKWGYCA